MSRPADGFFHEAALYAGDEEFLAVTVPFAREGVAAGEPVMVALAAERLELVRAALDGAAEGVTLVDMAVLGRNPARIIPAWREFVAEHSGRRIRGIGEPIWHGRSTAELVECQHHEHLLNAAVAEDTPLWLRCPYDTARLPAAVIDEARHSHPVVCRGGTVESSDAYAFHGPTPPGFDAELPPLAGTPAVLEFGRSDLASARAFTARQATAAGLDGDRTADLLIAVNELATNSIRYGGGRGTLSIWRRPAGLVCEVRDRGRIPDAMLGRSRPEPDQLGGHGLWIVNQLCDLVQVRSTPAGSVVRVFVELAAESVAA